MLVFRFFKLTDNSLSTYNNKEYGKKTERRIYLRT